MAIPKGWQDFIRCLNEQGVDYLVVGATAVAYHGFPRFSGDIDFLVRASEANALRAVEAIRAFGMGSLGLSVADFDQEGKVVQFGFEPNRIDVITSLSGVSFEEAWESRVTTTIDGLPINMIGLAALLRNKESTGRSKDQIDAFELRKMEELE